MGTWRWYSKVLFGIGLLAFAWLVWPTPWRYERDPDVLLRIHRVTGATEVWDYSSNYWRRAKTAREQEAWERELDAAIAASGGIDAANRQPR